MNNVQCLKLINDTFEKSLKAGLLNLQVKWLIDRTKLTERYEIALEKIDNILEGHSVTLLTENLAYTLSESGIYDERRKLAMTSSKLDIYDYLVLPGVIRIGISGVSDPVLVDILSEIELVKGRIYVEGVNYQYLDHYDIVIDSEAGSYMELRVVILN